MRSCRSRPPSRTCWGHGWRGLPRPARRLLLATALSEGLHVDVLEAIGDAAAVEDALDAGLLRADGDRVDAAHPLLAAAARQHARPKQRRALHAALAAAVREPEQRALHLALAAQQPDAALATEVEAAAAHASARGARPEAVALAEQALRLTPADDERRRERLLTLAGYCENAGERQRVTDVLTPELDSLSREARVRAWLLLSEGGAVLTRADRVAHLERALEEAGDELALRGRVLALKALTTAAEGVERIHDAEAWALEAFPAGPGADCLALRALGWTRSLSGLPVDDIDEQFRALTAHAVVHLVDSPGPVAALRLAWRGEIEPARAATTGFLAVAAERGEGVAHAWLRLNLCELELRAGEWDAASAAARRVGGLRRRAVADHAHLPALPRAARRRARSGGGGRALGGPGARGGRGARLPLAGARGVAGARAGRAARARPGARRATVSSRVGPHASARASTSPGRSRSLRIWSSRSWSSARATRPAPSPRGCARSPRPRNIPGGWRAPGGARR